MNSTDDEKQAQKEAAWIAELSGERGRLIRLCLRLTGSREAAEDLAQETLIEAWRGAPRLRDEAAWQAFVSGIARNLCQRWLRRKARENSFQVSDSSVTPLFNADGVIGTSLPPPPLEYVRDPFDMDEVIESNARNAIIDRALGAVSENTRHLLQERYLDDLPLADIAGRNGMSENAIAVRIHRARASLRRAIVADPLLSAEAAAWGIFPFQGEEDPESDSGQSAHGWQESRLWCPRCGKQRLRVRYDRDSEGRLREGTSDTYETPFFGVRCESCQSYLGFDFTSGHAALNTRRLLSGVSGFKPALNRLDTWWHNYYDNAIRLRETTCPICGRAADAIVESDCNSLIPGTKFIRRGLLIRCRTCGRGSYTTPTGVAVRHPEVREFYRRHPRAFLIEEDLTVFEGRSAILISIGSVTSSASLEVLMAPNTLTLLTTRCRD